MGSKKAYWLYQIIGWSVYFLSDLASNLAFLAFNFDEFNSIIGSIVVNVAAGVAMTHIFRVIFKRYNWIKLPVTQLVLRSVGVVGLITFVLAAINFPIGSEIINTEKMNWAIRDISYIVNYGKPVLIWVLIYVFYAYATERRNAEVERVKLEASMKETEAKVLRAQMNPHFVFNALNSIRALITEDPKKASNGITQLSNLLRSSLITHRRTTVSLKEELKTIEDYLSLEKIRYEDRLQSKFEIAPDTLSIQVPPMMLQTLVENAIKHGVQKALRWGFVEIKTFIEDNHLAIIIRNTGQLTDNKNKKTSTGFGIENTKRRLHLLYGNRFKFNIHQEDKLTVRAEIWLPLDKLKES